MSLQSLPWELIELIILQDCLSFSDVKNFLIALNPRNADIVGKYGTVKTLWLEKFRRLHPLLSQHLVPADCDGFKDRQPFEWNCLEEWTRLEELLLNSLPEIRRACFEDLVHRMNGRKDEFISRLLDSHCQSTSDSSEEIIEECAVKHPTGIINTDHLKTYAFEISPRLSDHSAPMDHVYFTPSPPFPDEVFNHVMTFTDNGIGVSNACWMADVLVDFVQKRTKTGPASLVAYAQIFAVHLQKISSRTVVMEMFEGLRELDAVQLILALVETCFPSFLLLGQRVLRAVALFADMHKASKDDISTLLESFKDFLKTDQAEPLRTLDHLVAELQLLWQHHTLRKLPSIPLFSFAIVLQELKQELDFRCLVFHFEDMTIGELLVLQHLDGFIVPSKGSESGSVDLQWIPEESLRSKPAFGKEIAEVFAVGFSGTLAQSYQTSLINQINRWVMDPRRQKFIRTNLHYDKLGVMYHHELCLKLRPTLQTNLDNHVYWMNETGAPDNVDELKALARTRRTLSHRIVPERFLSNDSFIMPVGSLVKYSLRRIYSGFVEDVAGQYGVICGRELSRSFRVPNNWTVTYDVIPIIRSEESHRVQLITKMEPLSEKDGSILKNLEYYVPEFCWLFFDRFNGSVMVPHQAMADLYSGDHALTAEARDPRRMVA